MLGCIRKVIKFRFQWYKLDFLRLNPSYSMTRNVTYFIFGIYKILIKIIQCSNSCFPSNDSRFKTSLKGQFHWLHKFLFQDHHTFWKWLTYSFFFYLKFSINQKWKSNGNQNFWIAYKYSVSPCLCGALKR